MNNYGYQNEYDFVELFNNKFLNELDCNSQKFLKELFGEILGNDEALKSWKNKMNQKTDIFIKYKNHIKNISLKCGHNNSMHCESIQDFKKFLEKLQIPYSIIDYYVSYHYGYGRDLEGKTDFSKVLSSEEYKCLFQKEIDIFNKNINKTKLIVEMVDRFIIRGRNSDYDVDALVCGTVDDYVWIMKYDLYDLVLSKRGIDYTSPHIACMTLGPKKRNLNGDSKNIRDRYLVCVRWGCVKEDIIEYKFKNNL
jgi:hypothetical protein